MHRTLDRFLAFRGVAERPGGEDRAFGERGFELVDGAHVDAALLEPALRAIEDGSLRRDEELGQPGGQARDRHRFLGAVDAMDQRDIAGGEVLGANHDA